MDYGPWTPPPSAMHISVIIRNGFAKGGDVQLFVYVFGVCIDCMKTKAQSIGHHFITQTVRQQG